MDEEDMKFPHDILTAVVGVAASWLIVVCNIIWYRAKFAIKKKGYPISLFYNHLQDYPNLKKIVAAETDPEKKGDISAF